MSAGESSTASPLPQTISLLESLTDRRVAADLGQAESGKKIERQLSGLLQQLTVFERISRCPILGITGLLNSGKSTLLATYLSPSSRQRVLRGLSNLSGTHRFVLWLPTCWRDQPELINTLEVFLSQLFGHSPEPLSEDISEASRQYNGHVLLADKSSNDPLAIPLVAYDSGLDELQLGLLDCPDIQTGFWSLGSADSGQAVEFAKQRQLRLASVGRLCSAFIVMSKMNSLHDQALIDVLTTLRDAMPGVPRILGVNRIKSRYAPEVVAQEARTLVERFAMHSLFIAYDYRSSLAHTRIPPTPSGLESDPDGSPQPVFFEVPMAGLPSSARTTKYLYHLGQHLDPGSLSSESCRSLVLQLKALSLEAIGWQVRNSSLRHHQVMDAWQAIAQACYDFMAERDASGKCIRLRLQTSPAIIAQMSDSLRRTAPLWLRPSLAIDRTARQLQQAVASKVERFKVVQGATQAVTDFARRFRRGEGAQVVTPGRLSRSLRSFDVQDSLQALSESDLMNHCQAALERFANEEQPELDTKALDQWTASIWKNMNWRDQIRRGIQPLALVTAPLLAAMLIPFDSGGTAVLVFATTNELLAAAGIAVLLPTMAGGSETVSIIYEETPWRQLGDLFAVLCDSLGLPRPLVQELPKCGSDARPLPESRLPIRPYAPCTPSDQPVFSIWKVADGMLARLQAAAERLN